MNSTISCPSCQRTLRVPESLLGQAVKCPSCSHSFTAPENLEETAPRRVAAPLPKDEDDEPRPSKRSRRDDEYDDDYEEAPRRRRRRDKPSKVQAIGIMTLIGGILALLYGLSLLGFGVASCIGLLWPGTYYAIVLGIMGLIRGIQLLGDKAYKESPPQGIAIMMIINVLNCDFVNLVLGILVLVFLSDEEVKNYFR
ncbi:MAG TPA: MJ0042-type zinc finger domain-containing protein [Gemmataceae bacterium]